ncbi:MAG: hypothetical protein Unbinned5081contig1001_30 [Prokaryotic dsDNA virus sp.]|nr:MAG: hypothetical protein Unbinned5081contig1001_30 [Prokaryotic dsDNA virus sp.]|tara:strand:- start:7136 stop:7753 length:618 start_codon:yes stop_codon:yes gene_type:complete
MTEQVDTSHINADIDEIATKAKSVSEKNGELRNMIKQKIDGRGYNAKALATLRSIQALSDEKLADFRLTFEAGYKEVIGRREGQPDMFPEKAPEELAPDTQEAEEQVDLSTDTQDTANDAYAAGMAAYDAGITQEGNPFGDDEAVKARMWLQGWNNGFDEDADSDAELENDLDEETVDQIAEEMDADMEDTGNVVQPEFGEGQVA